MGKGREGKEGKGKDLVIESSAVQLTRSSCADPAITAEKIKAMIRADALECIYENPAKLFAFDFDDPNSIRNDPEAMEEFLQTHVDQFFSLGKFLKQNEEFWKKLYKSINNSPLEEVKNKKPELVEKMMGCGGALDSPAGSDKRKMALGRIGVGPEDFPFKYLDEKFIKDPEFLKKLYNRTIDSEKQQLVDEMMFSNRFNNKNEQEAEARKKVLMEKVGVGNQYIDEAVRKEEERKEMDAKRKAKYGDH